MHGALNGSEVHGINDEDTASSKTDNPHVFLKDVIEITTGLCADESVLGAAYDGDDVTPFSRLQIIVKLARYCPLR
jgi:hypothetical protein